MGHDNSRDIFRPWNVLYINGELRDKVQMPLSWGTLIILLAECISEGLMVSVRDKLCSLQHVLRMANGCMSSKQFPVMSIIPSFCCTEIPREKF